MLAEAVREEKADVGFAYDGDADRLIAADERGEIVDGDRILYLLACDYREKGRLDNQLVIGTSHTNMGVQVALKALGIELMRSDVGDKYVIEMMEKTGAVLGGEQSGHIILGDIATTGDGILTSVRIAALLKEKREPFSALSSVALFPQANLNVRVRDKLRVLNDESARRHSRGGAGSARGGRQDHHPRFGHGAGDPHSRGDCLPRAVGRRRTADRPRGGGAGKVI